MIGFSYCCTTFLWYRSLRNCQNTEAYSEPCQISNMDVFAKILNNFQMFFFLLLVFSLRQMLMRTMYIIIIEKKFSRYLLLRSFAFISMHSSYLFPFNINKIRHLRENKHEKRQKRMITFSVFKGLDISQKKYGQIKRGLSDRRTEGILRGKEVIQQISKKD